MPQLGLHQPLNSGLVMSAILRNDSSAYLQFISDVKARVRLAHVEASRAISRSLVRLYWELGQLIIERQADLGWGQGVVERLSKDLRSEFPEMSGFSPQNLWLIRQFFMEYQAFPNLQQLVGEIPWGHNILIIQKVKDLEARKYYLDATARFGWTRDVLLNQIKAEAFNLSRRTKSHNFHIALPEHLAEQAEDALKCRYSLEFLGIAGRVHEREIERQLLVKLKKFLIELGYGFCFIGSQYRLTLGTNEYYLDLLFYHRFLKCLVVIELKRGRFRPEYAGKMDFYLDLLNETERAPDDNHSIGIILCAERDRLEVEFSLKSKVNPIGVAEYHLVTRLPEELQGRLPGPEDWQRLVLRSRTDIEGKEQAE